MIILIPSDATQYEMTLSEMIDEVSNHVRNDKEPTEITRWINMETVSIGSQYRFGYFFTTGVITTISGQRNYVLPTNFLWMLTMMNSTTRRRIDPADENQLAYMDPNYRTQQGTIQGYILNGKSIDLYRVPGAVTQIPYSYQRRPSKLVSLTDQSDLPPEWHPLITLGAARRGLRKEGRFSEIQELNTEYATLLKGLKANLFRRPDKTSQLSGPEILMGGGNRRPWPVLPSNYPRS